MIVIEESRASRLFHLAISFAAFCGAAGCVGFALGAHAQRERLLRERLAERPSVFESVVLLRAGAEVPRDLYAVRPLAALPPGQSRGCEVRGQARVRDDTAAMMIDGEWWLFSSGDVGVDFDGSPATIGCDIDLHFVVVRPGETLSGHLAAPRSLRFSQPRTSAPLPPVAPPAERRADAIGDCATTGQKWDCFDFGPQTNAEKTR